MAAIHNDCLRAPSHFRRQSEKGHRNNKNKLAGGCTIDRRISDSDTGVRDRGTHVETNDELNLVFILTLSFE